MCKEYEERTLMKTKTEENKRLVLEAFDTLFNKRDYAAAEKFWSPNYIQHSAHIAPGREGLFNLVKSLPPTLKYVLFCHATPRNDTETFTRLRPIDRPDPLNLVAFSDKVQS
jgi:hypothetical protein